MELFVDVPNFEGYYQVSNYGRVRSVDRVIFEKTGKIQTLKAKILTPNINRGGYYYLALSKDGKKKTFSIHQLVAQAFIPNPENKPTVNHIDGYKLNNRVSNLEWSTYSEQHKHAYQNNLRSPISSDVVIHKKYKRKLTVEQVVEIKELLRDENLTQRQIAQMFNVARTTIAEIKSGRRWGYLDSHNIS